MIFMIFFDHKGMNIIYLYFVNILYIYLRRNCQIVKFFFEKHGRYRLLPIKRHYLKILSEIIKVPNSASSHIWFLCEPNSTKKKKQKIQFFMGV